MVAAACTFPPDIGLKFVGELADVVQTSGDARRLGAAKQSGKRRCPRSDRCQMMRQGFPPIGGFSLQRMSVDAYRCGAGFHRWPPMDQKFKNPPNAQRPG